MANRANEAKNPRQKAICDLFAFAFGFFGQRVRRESTKARFCQEREDPTSSCIGIQCGWTLTLF